MVEFLIGKNVSKMILLPSLAASSLLLPLLVLIFHIGIALRGGGGVAGSRAPGRACSRFARRCSRCRRRRPDADAAATAVAAVAAALAAAALCHSLRFAVGLGSMNGVRAVASDSLKVYLNHTGPRGSAARLDNTFCTRFMWLHLYTSDKMFIHLTKCTRRCTADVIHNTAEQTTEPSSVVLFHFPGADGGSHGR